MDKLGPRFKPHSSAHFIVLSDSLEPRSARELADTAESTYLAVSNLALRLGIQTRPPRVMAPVVFFDQWSDYEKFGNESGFSVSDTAPGYFDERSSRCYIFDYSNAAIIQEKRKQLAEARDRMRQDRENPPPTDDLGRTARVRRLTMIADQIDETLRLINATVIRHEIAHQVMFSLGLQRPEDRNRRWLKEGLAMQFEDSSGFNSFRWAGLAQPATATRLTLRQLVADPKIIGPGAEGAQHAYALAWALAFYLIETRPAAFAEYAKGPAVEPGAPSVRAFEAAFGPLDDDFEAAFRKFIEKDRQSDK